MLAFKLLLFTFILAVNIAAFKMPSGQDKSSNATMIR